MLLNGGSTVEEVKGVDSLRFYLNSPRGALGSGFLLALTCLLGRDTRYLQFVFPARASEPHR